MLIYFFMCLVLNPDPQVSLPIHRKLQTLTLTLNLNKLLFTDYIFEKCIKGVTGQGACLSLYYKFSSSCAIDPPDNHKDLFIFPIVPNRGQDRDGICRSWGQHHYETFDGIYFYFPGTCSYILAQDCHSATPQYTVWVRSNWDTEMFLVYDIWGWSILLLYVSFFFYKE